MKVFIVAQFFPPLNVIGSVRSYQLAKYLSNLGHAVTVFTSLDNYASKDYAVDLSGIKVINVPNSNLVGFLDAANTNFIKINFFKQILRNITYPDHFVSKVNQYIDTIESEIKVQGEPDILFTMALPFSLHLVGRGLKNKYINMKWIADNRDLWAVSPYRKWPLFLRGIDRLYEKRVLNTADLVSVVTNHMKGMMSKYLDLDILVVLNGYSQESVIAKDKVDSKNFIYTGSLYNGLRDLSPLFESLKLIDNKDEIHFYGSEKNIVSNYQHDYPMLNIKHFDKVSKEQVRLIQNNAKYLLIALGTDDFEKGVLTGKFFEYVGSGKRIIAICGEDSELASLINKYKLGIATRSSEKISKFLESDSFTENQIPEELLIDNQFLKIKEMFISLSKELDDI